MAKPIRVAVFDGYALFRRGVVDALRGTKLMVVAEDETLDEADRVIGKCKPDIVLFDVKIAGGESEKIALLLRSHPEVTLCDIDGARRQRTYRGGVAAGRSWLHSQGVGATELVRALEGVHNGQPYISGTLATTLLRNDTLLKPVAARVDFSFLSSRDKQVLSHLAEGMTNQQIALRLGLTAKMVKRHLSSVFRKLGVRNRLQAALHARKHAKELGI